MALNIESMKKGSSNHTDISFFPRLKETTDIRSDRLDHQYPSWKRIVIEKATDSNGIERGHN